MSSAHNGKWRNKGTEDTHADIWLSAAHKMLPGEIMDTQSETEIWNYFPTDAKYASDETVLVYI